MIKYLFRLLAASSSLVALLLLTNLPTSSAIAATSINNYHNQDNSAVVSLNVVSSTLKLTANFHQQQLDHSGCSCAACAQASGVVIDQI